MREAGDQSQAEGAARPQQWSRLKGGVEPRTFIDRVACVTVRSKLIRSPKSRELCPWSFQAHTEYHIGGATAISVLDLGRVLPPLLLWRGH